MNATLTTLYLIHKIKQGFSYTIFYVKKINVGKVLKLLENCCFIILSIHVPKLEISGCDRDIIEHTLETDVKITQKKQKLRKMSGEKVKAVEAEVQRLQDAKVIREVLYPVWWDNTVPVKKKNGKCRMCVDFLELNKACKKDNFPLERVDKIVDDAANKEMLSLLDMFSGYHQIRVRREDEEKTSFITPFGTFYFVRMPEGLKNAGCTFSIMIAIVLHPQLRRNILAYVDDIVVKSI
jgi:hypothetical protein